MFTSLSALAISSAYRHVSVNPGSALTLSTYHMTLYNIGSAGCQETDKAFETIDKAIDKAQQSSSQSHEIDQITFIKQFTSLLFPW